MRILAIADEPFPGLPDVTGAKPDLIVSCGDLPWGDLERIVDAANVPLLFVPGNHDPALVRAREASAWPVPIVSSHLEDPPGPRGCISVDGRIEDVRGLRIAGLGGSVRYREGANQYTQQEMARRARRLADRAALRRLRDQITRLRSSVQLPPDADIGSIIMVEQERRFMEETGLDRVRPDAHIEFSRPQGYIELLEHLKIHGFHLMTERGEVLDVEEIAADWYDRVYHPLIDLIHRGGLGELWPHATDADLYLWMGQRRRELFPEYTDDLDLEGTVRAARETSERPKRRPRQKG